MESLEPNSVTGKPRTVTGQEDVSPVFILCGARSGSTLLQFLLGAHPEFWCPAETNLAFGLSHVFNLHAFTSPNPGDPGVWEHEAVESCRMLARATIGAAAEREKRPRWCDKSLTSVDHVDLLLKVFPNAKLITLYRNCRDFIESALEAGQWGLAGFGFEPYSREHPLNHPLALTLYWRDRVRKLLAAEEHGGKSVLRVTYESLVLNTPATLSGICAFIEAAYRPEYFNSAAVFDRPVAFGPQDHKINYTSSINHESIGRGSALPLDSLIPEELLAEINELETQVFSKESATAEPPSGPTLVAPEGEVSTAGPSTLTRRVAHQIVRRFEVFGSARVQKLTGAEHPLTCVVVVEDEGAASRFVLKDGAFSRDMESGTVAPVIRIGATTAEALMEGLIAPSVVERRHLIGGLVTFSWVNSPAIR